MDMRVGLVCKEVGLIVGGRQGQLCSVVLINTIDNKLACHLLYGIMHKTPIPGNGEIYPLLFLN